MSLDVSFCQKARCELVTIDWPWTDVRNLSL